MRAPRHARHLIPVAIASLFALAASGTYVVRSGETLSQIAARNGTSVQALVAANRLADPDLIVAGQSLTLPGSSTPAGDTSSRYVVQPGDTLARIAARFGTTVSALAGANNLSNPNLIVVGSALSVPGEGGGSGGGTAPAPSASNGPQLVGQRHVVRSGETISGIAARFGIRAADFVRWNGLVDGKIYAGASMLLYDPGALVLPAAPGGSSTQSHTVTSGETLSGIALRFGTTVSAIAKASSLSDADTIRIGQVLSIPGSSDGAGWVCPVAGATFMNDWGFPRDGHVHAGNDLFAPRGTPVRAPVSGWVDIATGSIGGHQFRLTAANGYRFYGSHLDRFGATGAVHAGDVIGYVGNTGNADGGPTHLHFEVHPGANAVNPYPGLVASCRG